MPGESGSGKSLVGTAIMGLATAKMARVPEGVHSVQMIKIYSVSLSGKSAEPARQKRSA